MSRLNCSQVGVTLLAYNRPEHTAQVLDAIGQQGVRNLTVFIDGTDDDWVKAQQGKIRDMVQSISWADCRIVQRDQNLGLARSVVSSITQQLNSYEQMILLEDDCIPQPHFFEFMFDSLAAYKPCEKIRSICGYQFPFAPFVEETIEPLMLSRFMPWGWATWADRWRDYTLDLKYLVERMRSSGYQTENLPADLMHYCQNSEILSARGDIWSINWALLHYLTGSLAVYPTVSLIQNIGFDGTGVHCVETDDFLNHSKVNGRHRVKVSNPPRTDLEFENEVVAYLNKFSHKTMFKPIC